VKSVRRERGPFLTLTERCSIRALSAIFGEAIEGRALIERKMINSIDELTTLLNKVQWGPNSFCAICSRDRRVGHKKTCRLYLATIGWEP
jgi:hypothetical protein